MKKLLLASVFAIGLQFSPAHAEPVEYAFDPTHTSIEFYVNHLGFSNFQAEFQKFDGQLIFDEAKPENSSVTVSIAADSIDTDVEKLDNHLKSADFFDVAQYPALTFKSKSIKITGANTGEILGDLTMHGVTKEVVLQTTLNKSGVNPIVQKQSVGFSASAVLKRSEFGISKFVPGVSDEVTIRIETEAQVK